MKYTDPSDFFKFIIEKSDINVINDTQKCLSMALDLLDSEKPYFNLFKISFQYNIYKELIKAYNKDSKAKMLHITKAVKNLAEGCFIKDDKAIWAVGWLASIIYSNEWNSFTNETNAKKDDKEIIWEQPKSKPVITVEESNIPNNKNIVEGKNWTLEDINLEMIYCPAGNFMMGSPSDELGEKTNEILHKVKLSKPFLIGKFPITQKQYLTIMRNNPSNFKGDNNPVECVCWEDAKKYCERLNNLFKDKLPVGCNFSLPTEAQWEYACRAGTNTSLNSGKNITSETGSCYNLDEVGWYCQNSGGKTHAVGQKKPNVWGIYDMHGNVNEWCEDWYGDYPSSAVTDPTGPSSGSRRVIRGGSFDNNAWCCRSASRLCLNPGFNRTYLGFRVALVPVK